MLDRRPYYFIGLTVGLVVVAFFVFGPKMTPEQKVAKDLAIMAGEPWHPIYVERTDVIGGAGMAQEAYVRGQRPDGTPVLVHFVASTPYTATTALRRLAENPPNAREAEILMIPRSMVRKEYRERFHPDATHVGIALFAGIPTANDSGAAGSGDMGMESESTSGS